MTKPGLSWRNASLPPKTAVFAIGDIHAQHELLDTLLKGIEDKIEQLPPDVQAHVVFIGDYIDRGTSAPKTIDRLLKFEKDMVEKVIVEKDESAPDGLVSKLFGWIWDSKKPIRTKLKVVTTFLCGNHDEVFKRLLEAKGVSDTMIPSARDDNDHRHALTAADGSMTLKGLEAPFVGSGMLATIKDYVPDIDKDLFAYDKDGKETGFNRKADNFLPRLGQLLETLAEKMPPEHKDFFRRVYDNQYLILGDYLFTHAGIDPEKSLAAQGVGAGAPHLQGSEYLDALMIRNPFLWRDDDTLPNCPYIVVHGHTPSDIKYEADTIADGQKNYRLCIDTDVYKPDGALTCFMRHEDQAGFMAVSNKSPEKVREYDIREQDQIHEEWIHRVKYPQYHHLNPQPFSQREPQFVRQ